MQYGKHRKEHYLFIILFLGITFFSSLVSSVSITGMYPDNKTFNISESIVINATVTDSDGVDTVLANVTYPNNTVIELVLTNITTPVYNISFSIPELPGDYSILVWANDTLNNAATNTSNFTGVFTDPKNLFGLQLWLDASDNSTLFTDSNCLTEVAADLDTVLCWRSKSSDATNATVVSTGRGARYRSNASEKISGSTVLRFNKSNSSAYQTGLDIRANTTEDLTIFTVYKPRTTNVSDQGQAIWGNDDGSWDRFYYSLFSENVGLGTDGIDDGLISLGGASNGLSIDGAGIVDKTFLLTAIYDGNVSGGTNSGPVNASEIYFDGDLQVAFTDESHATNAKTEMFVGRDGDNGYYDGDVAEIIVYNKTLGACGLEIVNKHLSSKYGKDFFGVQDNYGFSSPHNNDVNGIAEVNGNCTATVEITSGQSSIATISSPSSLDLNDSLTFAHDNGGLSLLIEAPAGYESRINQSWRVDEDNEPGNVTISFDISTTTISPTSSDFALLIDTNTNFSDATIHITGLSVSGSTVTFTTVNVSNGDYFTLGVTENFDDPRNLTNLRAWYDATDNTTLYTDESCSTQVSAAGDDVRCWGDKSDYRANATNVSGKGIPTFITNEFNGLSVLNFSKGETDTLRHVVPSQYTSNFTIFTVIQSKGDASTYDSFFSNGEPASTDHFQIDYTNDSGVNSFRYGSSAKFNFETYSNAIKLYSVTHNSTFVRLYNEGTEVNNGSTTEGQIFEHYRINQNRNGNQHHNSKIGEVILYDRVLSACELEKVNIYLGEKYGRDFFGIDDNYNYGSPHDNDINGIGEFNSSCTTSKEFTSAQSSIVTIFGASSIDLDDSLTFGHDNLGFSLASDDVPTEFETRLNQSWRVDEDNEPGNVSISFDLSSTGIFVTSSSNFALLIDNDTNFSDATVHVTGLSVSNTIINFTGINFTDGYYFTLAVTQRAPHVSFVSPTLVNNTVYGENNFTINMTSSAFGDDHYSFVNFDNSLLMWLRMDSVNATGDPVDVSGNGNDGTLQGGALINATGRFGDAAHFDGNGDYINLPASNLLVENQNAWTISTWFNAKSIASSDLGNRMITLRNASGLSATAFTLGGGNQLQFFYRNVSGGGNTINITAITTNSWYHYAVTYNGSASHVYVNGTLNATILDTITGTSSDSARIGANPTGSSQYFNGSIDEVLVLNHELTSDEIASLYNASANQYLTNTTVLSEGSHNFTGYAVGINGEQNQTETRVVTIDLTGPNGTLISPVNATVTNVSSQNMTVNVSDSVNLSNVTLFIYNSSHSLLNMTTIGTTGTQALIGIIYNFLYDGIFNWFYRVYDLAGNINETQNFTITLDTVPPSVDSLLPSSGTQFLQAGSIEIAANVNDTNGVSFVEASVTFPNGTVTNITLSNAGGNKYNASLSILDGNGTFTVSIFANDTGGNINNTESTSFIGITIPFIEFVSPTLSDSALHNEENFTVNISSNASGNDHYTFVDFNNSLVLWMRMDDVNTSGDPIDISVNENNGTLIGDALINSTGRFGNASHFDGNGDYVTISDSPSLRMGTGEFTYSLWFYANEVPSGSQQLFCKRTNSAGNYEVQIESGGKIRSWIENSGGGAANIDSTTVISAYTWYHITVTRGDGILRLYVNGAEENQTSSTHNVSSISDLFIGRDAPSAVELFNGSIDEVLVFNRSLTHNEVLSLYNATANQYENNFTNLSDGNYTFIGHAVSANGEKNQTETREVTIDTTAPSVTTVVASPNSTYNVTEKIAINATVTDAISVDTVLANITLPNGTIQQFVMSLLQGNVYNTSFVLSSVVGNYTVTIIANDTAGNVNSSENTTFELVNDAPDPSSVEINKGNDVTLVSASNKTVIGSATITDLNGYEDISGVTGYFFVTTQGASGTDNRSIRYTSSCTDNGDGSGNTVSYNCTFNVSHYAIPTDSGSNKSNTNWTFLISPLDSEGEGTNGTDVVEVDTLLSFAITPSTINFGSLNLGENTTNINQEINVTNNGNVGLDLLLSGTNFSCDSGIIPVTFLEYEDNPFTYGVGIDLLETGVELDLDSTFGEETNETPLRTTYYGLGSPSTGAGESCSGTIIITGQSDPHYD